MPTLQDLKGALHSLYKLVRAKSETYEYRNSFEFSGIVNLVEAWSRENSELKLIARFNDRMGDPGLEAIGEALKLGQTVDNLKRLHISRHGITIHGIKKFTDCLKVNKTLRHLILDHSEIDDETALILMNVVDKYNRGLRYINLEHNKLGDDFLESLSEIFYKNKALRGLYIGGNDGFTIKGAEALKKWIEKEESIVKLRSVSFGSSNCR